MEIENRIMRLRINDLINVWLILFYSFEFGRFRNKVSLVRGGCGKEERKEGVGNRRRRRKE